MKKNGTLTLKEERAVGKALDIIRAWLDQHRSQPLHQLSDEWYAVDAAYSQMCQSWVYMLEDCMTEQEKEEQHARYLADLAKYAEEDER